MVFSELKKKIFLPIFSRFHTSTNLTAKEIHQLGLQEVVRIEQEMAQVVKELGLNLTIKQFTERIREDKKNFFG